MTDTSRTQKEFNFERIWDVAFFRDDFWWNLGLSFVTRQAADSHREWCAMLYETHEWRVQEATPLEIEDRHEGNG